MKLISDSYRMAATLLLGACLLWSCQNGGRAPGDPVEVHVQIGADNIIGVRAFGNDDPLSVDRILVMPFTKSNAMAENNANYTAAPELAVQIDVDQFPVNDLKLLLSPMSTCKLVLLGFNRQNYDFYNRNPSTDDIVIDYDGPLSELSIEDRAAAQNTPQSAELFFYISDPFRPGSSDTAISALLTRMVGGISITMTYVPDNVDMRLYHTAPFVTRWRVADGTALDSFDTQGSYYTMTDQGGGVSYYSRYYFPTDGTPITMDIESADTSTLPIQTHRVPVATSAGSEFNLEADHAINLSGDYRRVILGQEFFTANNSNDNINIDDDTWDGVDDTPETDPETP